MTFDRRTPYNKLPLLPPKADLETKEILKKTLDAFAALSELKGAGNEIPDQNILIDSILLQEAMVSSEIENIITTHDKLYKALSVDESKVDDATKEVLRYREAVWFGFNALKRKNQIPLKMFIELCQMILRREDVIRLNPDIRIINQKTGAIVYSPPLGESQILSKLKNLEEYIRGKKSGINPLIKLAVMHYQFEAIHPFSDGNGRTGRILSLLYLVHQRILDQPILYLSKYIIENKAEYYHKLRGVTEKNEWEPWILYMLQGILRTSKMARNKIKRVRKSLDDTIELTKQNLPSHVYSKELIELIYRRPYTKVQFVVEAGIAQRQTAAEYLKELEKIGILKSEMSGKERLYRNINLHYLLSK